MTVEVANQADRPWNMTPEQVRMTAETISSVLSVPVFLSGALVGVVNLDDSKKLGDSRLADQDVRNAVEDLAVNVGYLLEKAGTDFRDVANLP